MCNSSLAFRTDTLNYWSLWQKWGPCSKKCGYGVKRRKRVCIGSKNGGCRGTEMEEKKCDKDSDGEGKDGDCD